MINKQLSQKVLTIGVYANPNAIVAGNPAKILRFKDNV